MTGRAKSWVSRRVADLEAKKNSTTPTSSSSSVKPPVVVGHPEGHDCHHELSTSISLNEKQAFSIASESTTAAHPGEADHHQAKVMAGRIAELEAALAASERRVVRLSSSATAAAAGVAGQGRGDAFRDIVAVERRCAKRVCQLEDALVQAEKRANWLQGELQVVSACGAQRVRELEDAVLRQQTAAGNEEEDCRYGGSRGEAPCEESNNKVCGLVVFSSVLFNFLL